MPQEYDPSNGRRTERSGHYTPSHLADDAPSGQHKRPRKKKRSRLTPLFYLIFVLGLSALLASFAWVAACDVLALNKSYEVATVTVTEGDSLSDVAKTLQENGLIEYQSLFKLFAWMTHTEVQSDSDSQDESNLITAGTYELNTEMDYRALISSMGVNSGSRKEVEVTITEGMTLDQIFALLEENGVASVADLQDMAANHVFKYSFLQDLPTGDYHRLEGFLFPDTYQFYMGGDVLQILNKMILRFDEQFTDEMRADAEESGYTVGEIVIIASMIEKETDGTDQALISSVIHNRLENPTAETGNTLGIDATILYVTGGTEVDVSLDSPYNTRIYPGLPPTAISCPGIDALRAAIYPEDTKYYYYALGDDGTHSFFRTLAQQQAFIASQERYQ
ncbi:endolytic transglycosylase MltG [Pseudoflavonifractor phocaeensis]|uniref:endolytic transglycosylase MltG n=1 Tax=Pseudoflavonifractor phocaeensis TaxID=1870988 RepID=UPI00195EFD9E|nr:endolytic transglycosylase MltG [Pseudoflavonifractor phocaeensis]MBM6871594.1 endolytic transglycosylase MltG [Pseudoflavonifractor phocaeensis]MBM6939521.1 endolytic transglycosylase MltG [Pseudoflavonifractor phocaeensis]